MGSDNSRLDKAYATAAELAGILRNQIIRSPEPKPKAVAYLWAGSAYGPEYPGMRDAIVQLDAEPAGGGRLYMKGFGVEDVTDAATPHQLVSALEHDVPRDVAHLLRTDLAGWEILRGNRYKIALDTNSPERALTVFMGVNLPSHHITMVMVPGREVEYGGIQRLIEATVVPLVLSGEDYAHDKIWRQAGHVRGPQWQNIIADLMWKS
jgi:hypothetical protein